MALKIGEKRKDVNQGGPVDVKGRFEILPDHPLPEMDSPPAQAFRAVSMRKNDRDRDYYAYICDPEMPPRLTISSIVARIDGAHLIKILDWDVVDWPLENRRCPVVICELPQGKRAFETVDAERRPMKEEEIIRIVVEPILSVLKEMHHAGVFHGAIRADNVFFTNMQESSVLLGEFYTSPPNVSQPIAYSTLHNALAMPVGRSPGSREDDMYALGITLLGFVMGKNPVAQFPDPQDLLKEKLVYGTYAAMALSHRTSPAIMELLRGLLHDDAEDRWTIDDLQLWVDGRRMNPRQMSLGQKASRPLNVNGVEYDTAREVAWAFSKNWDMVVSIVQDGVLDSWLRRSLSDDDRTEAVNIAKGGSTVHAVTQEEQENLVSRVIMALSPTWPVQVRNLSVAYDGLPQMIALKMRDKDISQFFVKVIDMGLIPFWLEIQERTTQDQLRVLQKLEKAKVILVDRQYGQGLERVVYELNDFMPCISVYFEGDYVPNLEYLLPALDRYCKAKQWDVPNLIDRHIAAYIAVHHKRNLSKHFQEMDKPAGTVENVVAQVRILVHLQETLQNKRGYTELAKAAVNLLQPHVEQFYSNDEREEIRKRMEEGAKKGRLRDILAVVDDRDALARDHAKFANAVKEFTASVVRQGQLYEEIRDRHAIAGVIGGKISNGIAATLGVFAVCVSALIQLF